MIGAGTEVFVDGGTAAGWLGGGAVFAGALGELVIEARAEVFVDGATGGG